MVRARYEEEANRLLPAGRSNTVSKGRGCPKETAPPRLPATPAPKR